MEEKRDVSKRRLIIKLLLSPEADPGVEDMLIDQDKAETAGGQKVTEPGDYDADEQMPGGVDLEKAQNQRVENTG